LVEPDGVLGEVMWAAFVRNYAPLLVLERLEASFFQIDEPLQVVAGSFEVQREGGAHDSHAAHQFSAHMAHGAEDVFDAGPWRGDPAVALLLRIGDRFVGTAFALDLYAPSSRCQRRFALGTRVAAVGVDVAAGVIWVEQLLKYEAVGNGGIGDDDFAHEFVSLVDAGVKLVAEVVLAMLLRPLGIDVFLRAFVRLPGDGHRAFFDRLRLFALVALNRCLDKRRIDDLAAACQIAVRQQLLLHLVEQLGAKARLGQAVAEEPDRLGIGDRAALGQAEKLQEAAAVQQLILECVVGQVVELLQDQYLGHQNRGIRRPSALGTRWARQGGIDFVGKRRKVDMLAQADEWIAQLRTSVATFFFGKQARLGHHHWAGSSFRSVSEFYRRRCETGEGF
jgi:hypothetical protein